MVTKSILKDRVRIRKDDIDSEVEEDTQTDLYSDQDVEGHVNEDDIEDSDGSILAVGRIYIHSLSEKSWGKRG